MCSGNKSSSNKSAISRIPKSEVKQGMQHHQLGLTRYSTERVQRFHTWFWRSSLVSVGCKVDDVGLKIKLVSVGHNRKYRNIGWQSRETGTHNTYVMLYGRAHTIHALYGRAHTIHVVYGREHTIHVLHGLAHTIHVLYDLAHSIHVLYGRAHIIPMLYGRAHTIHVLYGRAHTIHVLYGRAHTIHVLHGRAHTCTCYLGEHILYMRHTGVHTQ